MGNDENAKATAKEAVEKQLAYVEDTLGSKQFILDYNRLTNADLATMAFIWQGILLKTFPKTFVEKFPKLFKYVERLLKDEVILRAGITLPLYSQ